MDTGFGPETEPIKFNQAKDYINYLLERGASNTNLRYWWKSTVPKSSKPSK